MRKTIGNCIALIGIRLMHPEWFTGTEANQQRALKLSPGIGRRLHAVTMCEPPPGSFLAGFPPLDGDPPPLRRRNHASDGKNCPFDFS